MKEKLLGFLAGASCFLLLLTASIGLPIYIRPFYYAHIQAYDLEQVSGLPEEEIRRAYDQVLDYLTLPWKEFGTGVLPHSQAGADHFADCRKLFLLNGGVLTLSGAVLLWLLASGKGRHRRALFRAGVLALAAPVSVGFLAALDFRRAFVVFHSICFPGKTNWLFDPSLDPIILVMPMEFFRNCAILIAAGLVLSAGAVIWWNTPKLHPYR